MAGFSGSHGKEAKGVGIEAVELALITEARDNGLRSHEADTGLLVR